MTHFLSVLCFLLLFGKDALSFVGPRAENLVAFWPLDDDDWVGSEVNIEPSNETTTPIERYKIYEQGKFDLDKSPRIEASWRLKKSYLDTKNRGPFNILGTSGRSNDSSNFILLAQFNSTASVNAFTASFYYYHEIEPSENITTELFQVGNEKELLSVKVIFQKGDLKLVLFNRSKEVRSEILQRNGHPVGEWKFYAFTYDGTMFWGYGGGISASLFSSSIAFGKQNFGFDPSLRFGKINERDRFSSFVFYDTALVQKEISRLPCVTLTRGNCSNDLEFGRRRTPRPFENGNGKEILAFFPLDPETTLSETNRGQGPGTARTAVAFDPFWKTYLRPLRDREWLLEFNSLPQNLSTQKITISFHLFCRQVITERVGLVRINDDVTLYLTSCHEFQLEIINKKEIIQRPTNLTNDGWNFFSIYVDEVEISKKTFDVLIGPNLKAEVGFSCLSIFGTFLTPEDLEKLKCFCPGFGRQNRWVPRFIEFDCRNNQPNEVTSKILENSLLFIPFDKHFGFENLMARFNFHPQQKPAITKGAAVLDTTDGPNGTTSSYRVVKNDAIIASYEGLPGLGSDFSISFFVFFPGTNVNRTIFKIFDEQSGKDVFRLRTQKEIMWYYWGPDNRDVELKSIPVPDNAWFFFAITKSKSGFNFYYGEGNSSINVEGVRSKMVVEPVSEPMLSYDSDKSWRYEIGGPLYENDRISCFLVADEKLGWDEINEIPETCLESGYPKPKPIPDTKTSVKP